MSLVSPHLCGSWLGGKGCSGFCNQWSSPPQHWTWGPTKLQHKNGNNDIFSNCFPSISAKFFFFVLTFQTKMPNQNILSKPLPISQQLTLSYVIQPLITMKPQSRASKPPAHNVDMHSYLLKILEAYGNTNQNITEGMNDRCCKQCRRWTIHPPVCVWSGSARHLVKAACRGSN